MNDGTKTEGLQDLSGRFGGNPERFRDHQRFRSAVSYDWNTKMDQFVVIETTKELVGYVGKANNQPYHETLRLAGVKFSGGDLVERVDERTTARLSGRSWQDMRPIFEQISSTLLSVCPTAKGELTTIYVKYASPTETANKPYAVVWIWKTTEIVVGLALPEGFSSPHLSPAPDRYKYAGLTAYFTLKTGDSVPSELDDWAKLAFQNRKVE